MSKIHWSCHPLKGGIVIIARKYVGAGVGVEVGVGIPPSQCQDPTWSRDETLTVAFKVAELQLNRLAELEVVKASAPTLH